MKISSKQIKFLRSKAHHLNVVVSIGVKGYTEAVKDELELALSKHELIKVKLPADDKAEKKAVLQEICQQLNAVNVQLIGRIGSLYRAAEKPVIVLPN